LLAAVEVLFDDVAVDAELAVLADTVGLWEGSDVEAAWLHPAVARLIPTAAAMAMRFINRYVSTRALRRVVGGSDAKEKLMIVSVFVRRLKEGHTFEQFIAEWEADKGFGVPTRVFNSVSLDDPRDILTIGFVAVSMEELAEGLKNVATQESVRHERIDTVIESTKLKCMYDVATEHDFTNDPRVIEVGSVESLLTGLIQERELGAEHE